MHYEVLFLPLLCLIGAASIAGMSKACEKIGRIELKRLFRDNPHFYFFYFYQKRLFSKGEWDNLPFLYTLTSHLLRLLYATLSLYNLPHQPLFILLIILLGIFFEFFIKMMTELRPRLFLRIWTPVGSAFLTLFSPFTFPLLKLLRLVVQVRKKPGRVKDKILEFVHESELSGLLDPADEKLITSIASFRERIAKEIMVPRIDLYSLSSQLTVKEAAEKFLGEGYSRIPIYKDSVDDVVGVLNTKDIMNLYIKCLRSNDLNPLETQIGSLISPILYTPETKKISKLLQEFRANKIHIAIVVDEYGGTEGIVTIEDILEELVGEIADEYDFDEEVLFKELPGGGYILDARMNILDIEKEIGILIPQSPEYDTVGGYIYHKAGTIPGKGWRLLSDNFHLEVLSSSERAIEKVWIIKSH